MIDILVEDYIIIEVKAVETMHPVYQAQLITYLKLSNRKLGYLINFNVPLLKDGFKRIDIIFNLRATRFLFSLR